MTNYFDKPIGTKTSYQSNLLLAYACKYATQLSYQKVSELIGETCGGTTLSDQHIYHLVQAQAEQLTAPQKAKIATFQASGISLKASKVDIYSAISAEIIYLSDDVCVKKQKAKRDKQAKTEQEGKRHHTRISLFTDSLNQYQSLVAGMGVDAVGLSKAAIGECYPFTAHALAVVAITDGATSIKNDLKAIFGQEITHILN